MAASKGAQLGSKKYFFCTKVNAKMTWPKPADGICILVHFLRLQKASMFLFNWWDITRCKANGGFYRGNSIAGLL